VNSEVAVSHSKTFTQTLVLSEWCYKLQGLMGLLSAFTSSINTIIYQAQHKEKNMVFNSAQKVIFVLFAIWVLAGLFDKGEDLIFHVIFGSIIFGGLIWSARKDH